VDASNAAAPLIIDAGVVLTPMERFAPGRIVVQNGIIEAVGHQADVRRPVGAQRIDVPAFTVTPGFIDPHVHGCRGIDVMDAGHDELNVVSAGLASHGTTAFLPTTVSSPSPVLGAAIDRLAGLLNEPFEGAQPIGIHVEGPFINPFKAGVHLPENILKPDPGLLKEWIRRGSGRVKLLTLAPELENVVDLIRDAAEQGVRVAMGHSNADYDEAKAAADLGVCYAVHTFNAMRGFSHRDPGIVGAVLTDDRIFAEIIVDGVHVSAAAVSLFARAKSRDRVLLVTDAISATDMRDGEYILGGARVNVIHGVCRDRNGRLAGSTLTQEVGLRNFVEWTGIPVQDALFGVTANPADALQLQGRGRIRPGDRADLAILDADFQVMQTFVAGKQVFERHVP
jgi:N-acetylglucosamine-6-phosphate deacetylase